MTTTFNHAESLNNIRDDESLNESANLETSRFSATLESQIQNNTMILNNQMAGQDYTQSQRFLKVAPNAN